MSTIITRHEIAATDGNKRHYQLRIPRTVTARLGDARGFTLVELLMYMVLATMVVGSAYGVLVSQSRHSRQQIKTMDVRQTLRGAAALLTSNLRHVSTNRGDLIAIQPQALTLRATQGGGTVCAVKSKFPRFAIWQAAGAMSKDVLGSDDSVHVYNPGSGIWEIAWVKKIWDPGGAGVNDCTWGASYNPEMVLELIGIPVDTAFIGGMVRLFRVTEYGMVQWDGRWWLGQKVSGASTYDVLTGPLLSPSLGGLAFRYFDATGAQTAVPAQVERVEITLRAESHSVPAPVRDSVTTTVFLRN